MKLKRGYVTEITQQLTPSCAETIAQWIGGYTVIKNQKTFKSQKDFTTYLEHNKDDAYLPTNDAKVAYLQKELPFLKDIPCQIGRNAGAKWLEAMNSALIGLRKSPKIRKKTQKRNCYVTNELFIIQSLGENKSLVQLKNNAKKGNKSKIIGGFVVPFSKEKLGKSFYLSRKGQRFSLSIPYDKEVNCLSQKDLKKIIKEMSDTQLNEVTIGYDLGVKKQVTSNLGQVYHFKNKDIKKLEKIEVSKKRIQRRNARISRANDRQQETTIRKRTKNEKKILERISKKDKKIKNIRHNNSHCISKAIAEKTPLIAGFEDMNLSNLVRKPKAKYCEKTKKWLKNGRAAKRGLNKAILNVNMGQIRQFTQYKLEERGKILIQVKTKNSSRECDECGHTDKENRKNQALFQCIQCNHTANADKNAGCIIKKRTKDVIRSESFSKEKTSRKTSFRKKNTVEESPSSGCGDKVRLGIIQANVVEAPKTRLTNVDTSH
jgi:putative transposase